MAEKIIVVILFFGALLSAVPPISAQEDMHVVDNSVFSRVTRRPAPFFHDEHNEIARIDDCAVCHHLYEDDVLLADESSEDQQCVTCHAEKGGDNPIVLRRAFHLRCKGCHLEENAGPILCAQCHK